jgi:hypothetical protein
MKIAVQAEWKYIEATDMDSDTITEITAATPDGHYVHFHANAEGSFAHIYAVGCFQGDGAYKHALSGYKMTAIEPLKSSNSIFTGRYVRIDFVKLPPQKPNEYMEMRRAGKGVNGLVEVLETLHDFRAFVMDNVTQFRAGAGVTNPMWQRVTNVLDEHKMNDRANIGGLHSERYFVWDEAYYLR